MTAALLTVAMPLMLSEVLANEPGSVTSLEWIELASTTAVDPAMYTLDVNGVGIDLPSLALDSGQYLVVCRDTARFEAHYGDSSGVWGDQAGESYPLWQASFSLANSSGTIRLTGPGVSDEFSYSSSAPDGVSFERINDSLWGQTASPPGSTPGGRNAGFQVAFDWAVRALAVDPPRPRQGEAYALDVLVENKGSLPSDSRVTILDGDDSEVGAFDVEGPPGARVEVQIELIAAGGLNRLTALLDPDEHAENNESVIGFFGSAGPLLISEVYGAPVGSEPEWLELYVATDSAISLYGLTLSDGSTSLSLASESTWVEPRSYFVVTSDSAGLRQRYGDSATLILESAPWPTLNNSGEALTIRWGAYLVDRVVYPSFGSHRGVSLERIGDSDVWGLSVAAAGATPGARNSIDVVYTDQIELSVAPNPFAAGAGEQATIHYTVPFGATGEVRLYAGDGRCLRTLYPQATIVSGSVTWDGRGPSGTPCPVGVYLVQLRISEPIEQARLATVVIAR